MYNNLSIAGFTVGAGTTIYGIYLQNVDNLRFNCGQIVPLTVFGGSFASLTFDYSLNAVWPADCFFYGVDLGARGSIVNVGAPSAGATPNRIFGLPATNGQLANPNLTNLLWDLQEQTMGTAGATTSSASLVTVAGLSFTMLPNLTYQFEMALSGSTNTGSGDFAMTIPSGATIEAALAGFISTTEERPGRIHISGTASGTNWMNTAGTVVPVWIRGRIVNGSTPGVAQLQMKANGGGTLTLQPCSGWAKLGV